MSEWIDANERLPEKLTGMYLVVHLFQGKHPCQAVAAWFGDKFVNLDLMPLKVTHWQPLPTPPEASK